MNHLAIVRFQELFSHTLEADVALNLGIKTEELYHYERHCGDHGDRAESGLINRTIASVR